MSTGGSRRLRGRAFAFRQVVLTCRTQFFPKHVEDKRFGCVVVGGFRCNLLYLSPNSDTSVEEPW